MAEPHRLIAIGLACFAATSGACLTPRSGGARAGGAAAEASNQAVVAPVPAALADGASGGYRRRILLRTHHHARVETAGGRPWSDLDHANLNDFAPPVEGPFPYVVVDASPWPRVLSEYGGVRMLLYVDPADAHTVAVRVARLCAEADGGARGEIGLTIYPGLPVIAGARQGRTHVRIMDTGLRAEGWVESSDLGVVYEPVAAPVPPQSESLVLLRGGVSLRASPGGAILAETDAQTPLACEILSPGQAGFTEVLIQNVETEPGGGGTLRYQARAFVASSALGERGTVGVGSPAPLPVAGHSETFPLPRATRLYDHPRGSMVGLVVGEAFVWFDDQRESGWRRVWVPTPWGALALWMAPSGWSAG